MSTPELLSLAIGWEMALCFIRGTVFLKREQLREITVPGGQAEKKKKTSLEALSEEGKALKILSLAVPQMLQFHSATPTDTHFTGEIII